MHKAEEAPYSENELNLIVGQYREICLELRAINLSLQDLTSTLNRNMVRISEKSVPMRTHILTLLIALGVSNVSDIVTAATQIFK